LELLVEDRVVTLRRSRKIGPVRIAMLLGMPASTVHKVLVRHDLSRLSWMDRPTGERIRRYQREHPGELVHLDVKKVGKIPSGGGWRVRGRGAVKPRRIGYSYLHVAIDDASRVAFVEAHDDEKAETLLGFWSRARKFFHAKGMIVDEVMTDNGRNFTSKDFALELVRSGTKHRRTRPYRPQTNGKVERFNRTMADEFLYANVFRSGANVVDDLTTGSTSTTVIGTTPPSVARPRPECTTCVGTTPRCRTFYAISRSTAVRVAVLAESVLVRGPAHDGGTAPAASSTCILLLRLQIQ
jgi:transposase InsO family protein